MTLETLFDRAGLNRFQRYTWFAHCRFDGLNLACWDDAEAACIERCFMDRLREVLPTIRLTRVSPPPSPSKPKPSIWKKGREPIPQDML